MFTWLAWESYQNSGSDPASPRWGTRFCIPAPLSSMVPEESHDSLFSFPISHVFYSRIYCASFQGFASHHLLTWNRYFRGSHSSRHKNDQINKIQKLLQSCTSELVGTKCGLMHSSFLNCVHSPWLTHVIFQPLLELWSEDSHGGL